MAKTLWKLKAEGKKGKSSSYLKILHARLTLTLPGWNKTESQPRNAGSRRRQSTHR
jgi:hypothetical protein